MLTTVNIIIITADKKKTTVCRHKRDRLQRAKSQITRVSLYLQNIFLILWRCRFVCLNPPHHFLLSSVVIPLFIPFLPPPRKPLHHHHSTSGPCLSALFTAGIWYNQLSSAAGPVPPIPFNERRKREKKQNKTGKLTRGFHSLHLAGCTDNDQLSGPKLTKLNYGWSNKWKTR